MPKPATSAPEPRVTKQVVKRFRTTAAEGQLIEEKALQAHLTFSEYCRRAALDRPLKAAVPDALRQQLYTLGDNLNRLTRLAQARQLSTLDAESLKELLTCLYTLLRP